MKKPLGKRIVYDEVKDPISYNIGYDRGYEQGKSDGRKQTYEEVLKQWKFMDKEFKRRLDGGEFDKGYADIDFYEENWEKWLEKEASK
jgi:hypothetical protein